MSYAEGSSVPVDRSRTEIEHTLKRYGADQFAYATSARAVMICFRMKARMVRFHLPIPERDEFKVSPGGRMRSDGAWDEAYQSAIRQRWRALALVIKAKLEAVKTCITDFEEEFLAHIVLPGGKTVWETSRDEIRIAYETGKTPDLLLGYGPTPAKKRDV